METDVTRMAYLACSYGKAHMMIETTGMAYSPCGAVAMAHVGTETTHMASPFCGAAAMAHMRTEKDAHGVLSLRTC